MTRWLILILTVGSFFAALIAGAEEVGNSTEVVVIPKTHERHLRNPGMGLILYYHPDPAFKELPEEADILFMTLVWHDVEKKMGEYRWKDEEPIKWDSSKDQKTASVPEGLLLKILTQALALAKNTGRRVAIRLVTSWQDYPNPIPDYLLQEGVRLFPYKDPQSWQFKCFFEPEWWHPKYCEAFKNLIKAYGAEFDGNPLIEWIDMRYYGFWGEGHRWGRSEPWPRDVDKREYCRQWIDLHFDCFRKTPLAVQTASDEMVPYPEGTAIDYAVEKKGAWMRRDGFGSFLSEKESAFLKANWKKSVLIAENGRSIKDHLENKVSKTWIKGSKPISVEELFDEMFEHHVNYLPLGWGMSEFKLLKEKKPELLKKASLKTGYRFVVSEARWPKAAKAGTEVEIKTTWRNEGVGHLPVRLTPKVFLLDKKGRVLAEGGEKLTAPKEKSDPATWVAGSKYSVVFGVQLPLGAADACAVAVGLVNEKQASVVSLGIEGDDGNKRFVLGEIQLAGN